MVNIDERARRSSDSPEPRPEHIPDSLTPEISEDRNQSLNHDRPKYPFCGLPPDVCVRSPRRNKQEISSDSDSSPEVYHSDGQSKDIDRSKGYCCRKGWVKARPASFGKGKEIFAEYKEKFKALYEEMINHTLLAENLTLPGRVGCADNAREEAFQIVLKELKEEHNSERNLEDESLPFYQYRQFIGFDIITEMSCGGRNSWVPPLDEQPLDEEPSGEEQPLGEEQPREKSPVKKRQGGGPLWLY